MQRYEYDQKDVNGWKSYPIRVEAFDPSGCHEAPRILVQSMAGGYVTANCLSCGNKEPLSESEFKRLPLFVSCPRCARKMIAELVPGKSRASNYGFVCNKCDIYIWFADLLPHWTEAWRNA